MGCWNDADNHERSIRTQDIAALEEEEVRYRIVRNAMYTSVLLPLAVFWGIWRGGGMHVIVGDVRDFFVILLLFAAVIGVNIHVGRLVYSLRSLSLEWREILHTILSILVSLLSFGGYSILTLYFRLGHEAFFG